MKFFKLPWPDQALELLGGTTLQVRSTLSYFAEPNPGNTSRGEAGRYSGHKLKFGFKRYQDTDRSLQGRYNASPIPFASDPFKNSVDEEGEIDGNIETNEDGWLLKGAKNRGTLHQDIWTGPAYELIGRDAICVAPNNGWWSTEENPEDREVNFSLIVTVSTPNVKARLFTEALAKVPPGKLVTPIVNPT